MEKSIGIVPSVCAVMDGTVPSVCAVMDRAVPSVCCHEFSTVWLTAQSDGLLDMALFCFLIDHSLSSLPPPQAPAASSAAEWPFRCLSEAMSVSLTSNSPLFCCYVNQISSGTF